MPAASPATCVPATTCSSDPATCPSTGSPRPIRWRSGNPRGGRGVASAVPGHRRGQQRAIHQPAVAAAGSLAQERKMHLNVHLPFFFFGPVSVPGSCPKRPAEVRRARKRKPVPNPRSLGSRESDYLCQVSRVGASGADLPQISSQRLRKTGGVAAGHVEDFPREARRKMG